MLLIVGQTLVAPNTIGDAQENEGQRSDTKTEPPSPAQQVIDKYAALRTMRNKAQIYTKEAEIIVQTSYKDDTFLLDQLSARETEFDGIVVVEAYVNLANIQLSDITASKNGKLTIRLPESIKIRWPEVDLKKYPPNELQRGFFSRISDATQQEHAATHLSRLVWRVQNTAVEEAKRRGIVPEAERSFEAILGALLSPLGVTTVDLQPPLPDPDPWMPSVSPSVAIEAKAQ
ncbi:DUF4230 domain-containing protein [Acrocarpospora sp. B8E8]|uniref:DUF4230 domain-containing protein n=1 Tax=Acrocarpospora sp. B8E8 TaxID=3153572 RepID=UPI00325D6375